MVAAKRNDIIEIDGGMVNVPGAVDFQFNAGKTYACGEGQTIGYGINRVTHRIGASIRTPVA